MSSVALEGVGFAYPGGRPVLDGVTARAEGQEVIAILGPNGAGKSTLLDIVAGLKRAGAGRCLLDGRDAAAMSREEAARVVAHVPQALPGEVPFTVEEVILTGRIAHGGGLYESEADYAALDRAIGLARLEGFRGRRYAALSGGEKQRVLVAAALCQETPVLLLDEPGAHLDPENEAALWELLRGAGRLVLMVTHHLALAAQNADRVWLLDRGRLVADGAPCDAMRPADLERVFHVPFHWHQNGEGRVFLSYGR